MSNISLIELIKTFKTEEAIALLKKDPDSSKERDQSGVSAILWAAYYRNEPILTQLKSIKDLNTDIFESCALGLIEAVKKDIATNPEVAKTLSPDGFHPLGLACFFGHLEIVEFLLPHSPDVNIVSKNSFKVAPLHSAVASQSAGIVKVLLDHGADPNLAQQNGILPLHSASHTGNIGIIKLLINHGADRSLRSEDGKSSLDYALDSSNSEEVIDLLKNYE